MAIGFSVLKASPYSLRYLAIAAGVGADNTLTQTQLIADAKEGPLKSLLQSSALQGDNTPANDAWVALFGNSIVSVYSTPATSAPAVIGYNWGLVGGGNVHTLVCSALAAGTSVIEIRINHSLDR